MDSEQQGPGPSPGGMSSASVTALRARHPVTLYARRQDSLVPTGTWKHKETLARKALHIKVKRGNGNLFKVN